MPLGRDLSVFCTLVRGDGGGPEGAATTGYKSIISSIFYTKPRRKETIYYFGRTPAYNKTKRGKDTYLSRKEEGSHAVGRRITRRQRAEDQSRTQINRDNK